jgi:hypothetical protein
MGLDVRLVVRRLGRWAFGGGTLGGGTLGEWAVSLDLVLCACLVRHFVLLLSGAQRAVLSN